MTTVVPGWEGTVGPGKGQYGRPHVYARDVHSGAGNCVCGAAPGAWRHVQLAPGVDVPAWMRPPRVGDDGGMTATAKIYAKDKSGDVVGELDLTGAEWTVAAPPNPDPGETYMEYAKITHTDGVVYTALRKQNSDDEVLTFDPGEWDAFIQGALAGEFDTPWDKSS